MKIVYAADNRWGAAYQLKAFVENTSHEVKVAAYTKSGRLLSTIDWNLDAAKNNLDKLQLDIERYYPDFVLVDCEPIIANIAAKLDIPILYCSSLHLLDGLVWYRGQREYSNTIEQLRRKIYSMPAGITKLIYAPYGDLVNTSLQVNEGFEWIQPYHTKTLSSKDLSSKDLILSVIEDPTRSVALQQIYESSGKYKIITDTIGNGSYLSNLSHSQSLLIEGNAREVADSIYNNKRMIFIPQVKDAENVLNAIVCSNLKIGINLNQIELAGTSALSKIENAIEFIPKTFTVVNNHKKLHERIDELWECV